jgi:hypothetical protein
LILNLAAGEVYGEIDGPFNPLCEKSNPIPNEGFKNIPDDS